MYDLQFPASVVGIICQLLRMNKVDAIPLLFRMRDSANGQKPNGATILTVPVTEGEMVMFIRLIGARPLGIYGPIALAIKNLLLPQIAAGIAAEGPDKDPVFEDDGVTPKLDPFGKPVMISRPWARIAATLSAIETTEDAQRAEIELQGITQLFGE